VSIIFVDGFALLAPALPMKIPQRLGNLDARPEDGGISP
jgi:hypothetical protein